MRPVYIICAECGAEDQESHLVSLFNIIERIEVKSSTKATKKEGDSIAVVVPTVRYHVVAVWMRENDDPDQEFESSFRVEMPGKPAKEFSIHAFRFDEGKLLQRFRFAYEGPPFFRGSGLLRFVSCVRPVGSEKWMEQDYPIVVVSDEESAGTPVPDLKELRERPSPTT